MNVKYLIYLLASICMAACSGSYDAPAEGAADNQQENSDQMVSNEPIVFAPVDLADMRWETETRGGSVEASDFSTDSIGVFCLAKKRLSDDSKDLSWNRPYTYDLYNQHIVWTDNLMASITGVDGNQGVMTWGEDYRLQYYPQNAWYSYGFVAYRPWTEHVVFSKSTLKAYIKVDGNDDVMYAMADKPGTTFGGENADVDELSFSRQYFAQIRERGLSWDGVRPKLEFRHLMSRLDFYFCFAEMPERAYHVDKVEFDDFRSIMELPLASCDFTTGAMTALKESSTLYVLNDNSDQLGVIKTYDGTLLQNKPGFESIFGHFELREQGETPISGIRQGGAYKYNLTTEMKKVGDCILIPPVKDIHQKRDINLLVTICDNNGHKYQNTTAKFKIMCPTGGWLQGRRYDVLITMSPPIASSPGMRAAALPDLGAAGQAEWVPQATVDVVMK